MSGMLLNPFIIGGAPAAAEWDIKNSAYNGTSFDTNAVVSGGAFSGIFIKPDGTQLWANEAVNDLVHSFSFSTPWDLSTLSDDASTVSIGGQAIGSQGVHFNNDGSKMYVVDSTTSTIYEYDLSVNYDHTTRTYNSVNLLVSGQMASPLDMFFRASDGERLYVPDPNGVYQYDLTTGFDLSTASYSGNSFSLPSGHNQARAISFKPDGTRMFTVGTTNDNIYQYDLSTPWDLSTAAFTSGDEFDVSGQDGFHHALFFKPDGTRYFTSGLNTEEFYEYDIS